uniref:Uncharacterized protein LOC114333263 isoform X1 n=1 Tax=Diabrotica virgifera virgifera TaxID=50390 RepID=A0A6P7FVY4_DIAVI
MLVSFIQKVNAPVWFYIKLYLSCSDGSKHLWRMIHYSRFLPVDQRKIVDAVIQRNAYFAHPENVLLSMMKDERKHIQELGLHRVPKARESQKEKRSGNPKYQH